MARIFYDGHQFLVPDWAEYIVQNPDGSYMISLWPPVLQGDRYVSDTWEYILPLEAQTHVKKIKR